MFPVDHLCTQQQKSFWTTSGLQHLRELPELPSLPDLDSIELELPIEPPESNENPQALN